jgi:cell filamentation protein
MRRLFDQLKHDRYLTGLGREEFARKGAHFLAEVNAIHLFREGNGRTQLTSFAMLAEAAGHALDCGSAWSTERHRLRSFR